MAKEISCKQAGIDYAFLIRSDDTPELVDFVQEHCNEQHGVNVSKADLRKRLVESERDLMRGGPRAEIDGSVAEFN